MLHAAEELAIILRRHLPFLGPEEDLGLETPLLEYGLDSLGMLELVEEVEEVFAVRFPDEVLGVELFATSTTLLAALERLRAESPGLDWCRPSLDRGS